MQPILSFSFSPALFLPVRTSSSPTKPTHAEESDLPVFHCASLIKGPEFQTTSPSRRVEVRHKRSKRWEWGSRNTYSSRRVGARRGTIGKLYVQYGVDDFVSFFFFLGVLGCEYSMFSGGRLWRKVGMAWTTYRASRRSCCPRSTADRCC